MSTQKKTHYQFWFLIFCFFTAIAGTFLLDHYYTNITHAPSIHNGTLSLTEPAKDVIYLDGDWEAARKAVLHHFAETLELAASGKLHKDYKTALQEELQKNGDAEIRYTTDREEGPDHNKTFYVSVWSKGRKLGEGQGHSKKEAEQKAAAAGLQQLSEETDKNEV